MIIELAPEKRLVVTSLQFAPRSMKDLQERLDRNRVLSRSARQIMVLAAVGLTASTGWLFWEGISKGFGLRFVALGATVLLEFALVFSVVLSARDGRQACARIHRRCFESSRPGSRAGPRANLITDS